MATLKVVSTVDAAAPRLMVLEAVIERGLKSFIEVGMALKEIRDARLYRDTHKTFDAYLAERWEFTRMRASQLINAADSARIAGNVNQGLQPPATERQARPLNALNPAQKVEAWKEAVETAPDSGITGAHVQAVVARIRPVVAPVADVAAPTITKRQKVLGYAQYSRMEHLSRTLWAFFKWYPNLKLDKVRLVRSEEEIAEYARELKAYIRDLNRFHDQLTRRNTE